MQGQEPDAVEALAQRARAELESLSYPAREWVVPRVHEGAAVYDAVIVGGGQNGVAIAARLLRERVTNICILDRNRFGFEGPWVTFARMHTLRTPKHITGPDIGIPSLAVDAWWEARFGKTSWDKLDKIPRELWQEYLHWVRRTIGVKVTNEAEALDIEPITQGLLAVHARIAGKMKRLFARNVVLATGMEGSGDWMVPAVIAKSLPRASYAHTADHIDFSGLAGKRIAVVGAGASAFDNAATALEQGARSVDQFVRRERLPTVNPNRWIEFAGFLRHFADLDDAQKWRFMKLIFDRNQPPPQDTFDRCARHSNFNLHLGSPVTAVKKSDAGILLKTPHAEYSFDFLIVGTGFVVDLSKRPELGRFVDRIARWSDRYRPPPGEENGLLGDFPYLSDSFQFTEKTPGDAPFLKNVFSYTFGAMLSLANTAGISQLKFGLDRITAGVTRELFLADVDRHFESLKAYDEPELVIPGDPPVARDPSSKVA